MSRQTDRISRMEQYLNESREAVDSLDAALDRYVDIVGRMKKLDDYYTGPLWMKDFEAWEAGRLPKDLKCGVLSEDAVYDLLSDNHDLIEKLGVILQRYLKEHW